MDYSNYNNKRIKHPLLNVAYDGHKPVYKIQSEQIKGGDTMYQDIKVVNGAKFKRLWDNKKTLGSVRKAPALKIDLALAARDGVKYVQLIPMYKRKRDNEWKHGLGVLNVPIEYPIDGEVFRPLEQLISALSDALTQLNDFAIEDKENAVWVPVVKKQKEK